MDDGRVPIDIVEGHVPAAGAERSYSKEDGTLVIDILVAAPCGTSSEGEIVVCASDGSQNPLNAPEPPPQGEIPKAEIQLGENAKAGLRAQPGRYDAVEAVVNLTVKF